MERWESEVKRLTALVKEKVVDQQILDETRRQLKSSQAALRVFARGGQDPRCPAPGRGGHLAEDQGGCLGRRGQGAGVGCGRAPAGGAGRLPEITAPYDGVVFARNVNLATLSCRRPATLARRFFPRGVARAGPRRCTSLSAGPGAVHRRRAGSRRPLRCRGTEAACACPRSADHEFTAKVTRTSVGPR